MKLVDRTLEEFGGMLASASPTPGGGTCSALNALLGAGFIAMVARITAEKPDFARAEHELRRVSGRADELCRLFLRLIDEDSAAYERFAAAKASLGTPASLGPRTDTVTAALRDCVRLPLELMEGAAESLCLARELSARYYLPTASDLGIAALNLEASSRGAYLTVCINLKGGGFNAGEAEEYMGNSRLLLAEAEALSKEIYDSVRRHVEN
jgi:formiminotetrahydrofolate cyclodeaminase